VGPPISCRVLRTSCRTGTGAGGEAINQRGFGGGWGWAMSTYTPRLPAGLLARWPPLSASGVRLSISVCPSNLFLRCIHVQCPPHRWWRPGGTGGSSRRIRSEIPASEVLLVQGNMTWVCGSHGRNLGSLDGFGLGALCLIVSRPCLAGCVRFQGRVSVLWGAIVGVCKYLGTSEVISHT
jgi:hypothetical protein